ncbi:hypothetical protein L873DRAFT_1847142 [Choiromyces venosus 120613-1]|uniref:Uncharacterized protein n=1 Tax=Choiromyces venosus 120613-1 TaxID=1336337 RepID=A0A3N4J5D3_9PEZI|nr:hypothetical protein L873DRAFT_1847142 [Choiromyces venosus 120613-1]
MSDSTGQNAGSIFVPPNPYNLSGAQPTGARGQDERVHLTKDEKLVIIHLCLLYAPEYSVPSGQGEFWKKVARLASQQLGRPVKNPSQMMRKMRDDYVILMASRSREMGTAQPDGEYEQSMEKWKHRVDSSGDGRGSVKPAIASSESAEVDKVQSEIHHHNMISTLSGKQTFEEALASLPDSGTGSAPIASSPVGSPAIVLSKSKAKEKKVEGLKEKRRKIQDQGKHLDEEIAAENIGLTKVLDKNADGLLAQGGNKGQKREEELLVQIDSEVGSEVIGQVTSIARRMDRMEEKQEEIDKTLVQV